MREKKATVVVVVGGGGGGGGVVAAAGALLVTFQLFRFVVFVSDGSLFDLIWFDLYM